MMKKLLTIILAAFVVSCSSKYGKAGDNAAQYVREQMPEAVRQAESVEPIEMGAGYLFNIDSCLYTITDNESARKVGKLLGASNMSIHGPEEFLLEAQKAGLTDRRKTFMIEITYKSSNKKNVIVIMDKDGVTPAMTLDEYNGSQKQLEERLNEYTVIDVDKVLDDIEEVTE